MLAILTNESLPPSLPLLSSVQFRVGVQQFEFFVSSHMYVLTSNPRKEDIVQLALLLPDTSDIYCQAVSLALGDRKKSWFKWRYM